VGVLASEGAAFGTTGHSRRSSDVNKETASAVVGYPLLVLTLKNYRTSLVNIREMQATALPHGEALPARVSISRDQHLITTINPLSFMSGKKSWPHLSKMFEPA